MLKQFVSLIFLITIMASWELMATDISGRITIDKQFIEQYEKMLRGNETSQYRGYWNEPNGIMPIASPDLDFSSDFGLVLIKENGEDPNPDSVQSIDVHAGKLERNVTIIRPKSRLNFIVQSPFEHELYSPGKHDFKPQLQGTKSSRPIDFHSPGFFEIKCNFFPAFQGWVVVENAAHVADINSNGNFSIEGVLEGTYLLKVFFAGNWIYEQKQEISGRRQDVNIKLDSPMADVKKAQKEESASEDKENE